MGGSGRICVVYKSRNGISVLNVVVEGRARLRPRRGGKTGTMPEGPWVLATWKTPGGRLRGKGRGQLSLHGESASRPAGNGVARPFPARTEPRPPMLRARIVPRLDASCPGCKQCRCSRGERREAHSRGLHLRPPMVGFADSCGKRERMFLKSSIGNLVLCPACRQCYIAGLSVAGCGSPRRRNGKRTGNMGKKKTTAK